MRNFIVFALLVAGHAQAQSIVCRSHTGATATIYPNDNVVVFTNPASTARINRSLDRNNNDGIQIAERKYLLSGPYDLVISESEPRSGWRSGELVHRGNRRVEVEYQSCGRN